MTEVGDFNLRDLPGLTPGQLVLRRRALERKIAQVDPSGGVSFPQWADPGEALVTLVLPFMSAEEYATDNRWSSRAMRYLRGDLQAAGIWDEWVNVIYCSPRIPPQGAVSPLELRVDRPLLLEALELTETRWTILVGAQATSEWRKDIRIGWCSEGGVRVHSWRDRWLVWPIEHPNAMMHPSAPKRDYRNHLVEFGRIVGEGAPRQWNSCVKCRDIMAAIDADGVAWCQKCAGADKSGIKGRNRTKREWGDPLIDGQMAAVFDMEAYR